MIPPLILAKVVEDTLAPRSSLPIVRALIALARRVFDEIVVHSLRRPPIQPQEEPREVHELVVRGFIRVRSPTAIVRWRAPRALPQGGGEPAMRA
jgi:hypothetical protein